MSDYRTEKDSLGTVQVPQSAYYGAQTQRAVENFPRIRPMPRTFIEALGLIKWAAAGANESSGALSKPISEAIQQVAEEVAQGQWDTHFPVDVFQTGSGTSSNMNANEVIAHLASERCGLSIHPNDHVNYGQSSNDVIPTAVHLSAALALQRDLYPALEHLTATLTVCQKQFAQITKTGRTHLMDAMPLRWEQEWGAFITQLTKARKRLDSSLPHLYQLAQGGTAIGTQINAPRGFSTAFCNALSQKTKLPFTSNPDFFEAIATQDTAVELSGHLKTLAVSLMKIANDLRWMNSGPLSGLGEIQLPAVQPGSSIMPGKVNPVILESLLMICAEVIGRDTTVTLGGQWGNFQLNTMLPLIADQLLGGIQSLSQGMRLLADKAIVGLKPCEAHLQEALSKNPILVTALNSKIGYEQGALIAKRAYAEQRPVLEIALTMTDLSREDLTTLLDPLHLTYPET